MPRKAKRRPALNPAYAAQPQVARILKMLKRRRGASTAEIMKAMEYASHSVRSVLSNLRRKSGIEIASAFDAKRGHVYRVAAQEQ